MAPTEKYEFAPVLLGLDPSAALYSTIVESPLGGLEMPADDGLTKVADADPLCQDKTCVRPESVQPVVNVELLLRL